jgi:hypothetical protein
MLESDVTEEIIEKELKLNDNRPYAQDRWEICKSCDKLTAVKFSWAIFSNNIRLISEPILGWNNLSPRFVEIIFFSDCTIALSLTTRPSWFPTGDTAKLVRKSELNSVLLLLFIRTSALLNLPDIYPPANTLDDPEATTVQAAMPSPTLPAP